MKAQRASAWLAVQSYKRKRAFASFAVCSNIRAFHESHVPVEIVRSLDASVEIGAGTGETQISFTDEAAEVEDQRWVTAIGMGSRGINLGGGWWPCPPQDRERRNGGSCQRELGLCAELGSATRLVNWTR